MPSRSPSQPAAVLLTRLPVVLAAAVAAVTLVAVPLVLLDLWSPVVAVPVAVVVAALAGRLAWGTPVVATPWWPALTSLAVAVAGGVWAGVTHAEHVVLRRDAGSMALYAHQLAVHHGLPVDASLDAFGGAEALTDPGFTLASPAFYQVGSGADVRIVPQFLLGAPALFSLGGWAGGWTGLLLVPAVLGACALLAFAGLAARLVGPRWAPVAAAALALAQPVLHANRSTYSEPPALLVLLGAASLLVAATRAQGLAAARLGGGAGLLLGACGLVRIDVLREVAVLLPVVAVLLALRHPAARALLAGTVATTLLAVAAALATSRPYLGTISSSLVPLVAALLALAVVSSAAVKLAHAGWFARRRWLTTPLLGPVLAGVFALVLAALASRPLWLVVRQDPDDPGSRLVAGLQLAQGLPVDGGRTYAEHSVDWVAWYLGWPAVAVAGVVAVVLLLRLVPAVQGRSPLPGWTGPFVVAVGSTLLTLYRPGITPDHPWADRRLVAVVLPAVVLLAVAGVGWAVRELPARIRRLLPGEDPADGAGWRWVLPAALSGVGVVLLVLPAVLATAPVAAQRTERGQVEAVAQVCASFGADDVALAVDSRARNEWPQVLRGTCGVPAASVAVPTAVGLPGSEAHTVALRAAVERTAARIRSAGGNPVVVAAGGVGAPAETLALLGATEVRTVTRLRTEEDERVLVERPDAGQALDVTLARGAWPASTG